jgi:hypothetical protein
MEVWHIEVKVVSQDYIMRFYLYNSLAFLKHEIFIHLNNTFYWKPKTLNSIF